MMYSNYTLSSFILFLLLFAGLSFQSRAQVSVLKSTLWFGLEHESAIQAHGYNARFGANAYLPEPFDSRKSFLGYVTGISVGYSRAYGFINQGGFYAGLNYQHYPFRERRFGPNAELVYTGYKSYNQYELKLGACFFSCCSLNYGLTYLEHRGTGSGRFYHGIGLKIILNLVAFEHVEMV